MIFAIIFSMAMVIIITDYANKECCNNENLPERVYYNYHNTSKTEPSTPCQSPINSRKEIKFE